MVYIIAGTAGAALAGAGLAALGTLATREGRVVVATAMALVALPLGLVELLGRRVHPLQCDRETPQQWMNRGALRWAARNGLALGVGASTRLGFALWYVVPIASLLSGNIGLGAAVFASYGFCRTAAAYIIIRAARHQDFEAVSDTLRHWGSAARTASAGQLAVVGLVTLIVVGL